MAKAVGTTPKQLLPFAKVRASLPDSTCAVERRFLLAGANPAQQLSLRLVAARAVRGGNEMD